MGKSMLLHSAVAGDTASFPRERQSATGRMLEEEEITVTERQSEPKSGDPFEPRLVEGVAASGVGIVKCQVGKILENLARGSVKDLAGAGAISKKNSRQEPETEKESRENERTRGREGEDEGG